jgi:hypothetical protein
MNNVAGILVSLICLGISVAVVVAMWKVFTKAGQPGWACIVPIYGAVVLLQIAGKPVWWIVLFFIPGVNAIALILVSIALAEKFGKSSGFGVGLALLSPIFYPLLGFSDAQYRA